MGTRDRIRAFVRDSFLVDDFSDEDSFVGRGIVDSLGMMQLVSFVEKDLGVAVEDSDLVPENFDSVARVGSFVERKRAVRAV
jgi:acyl carrier protein